MKLKSYIFRWVTLATLLPATALGLFASYYVQNLYHDNVIKEIQQSLETISVEITRGLISDRKLILKLPESKAIKEFLPVLAQAKQGERHTEYQQKLTQLSLFLTEYQSVISLFDTFRILDIRGNTMLKVRSGRMSVTQYEGFDPYIIMDKEIIQNKYVHQLEDLFDGQVSFIELPQTREEMGLDNNIVIPDGVVPLVYQGERVGYLAVTIHGDNVDQVLELAMRMYEGKLLIAEINDENELRNGQILYDDHTLLRFAHLKSTIEKIQDIDNGLLWDAFQENPYGSVANSKGDNHAYYIEYFPYPNSLTSWVIVNEIEDDAFTKPFEDIRAGIWILSMIAALGSLILAHYASRAISTPMVYLAKNLKTFADEKKTLVINSDIDEIQQTSESFTYMAKTLKQAHQDRIQAENKMIQNAKLASLGQMAAGIGHEINNPLNNIRSLCRLIRRDLERKQFDSEHLIEDIKSLDEEVIRASDIVQGVLSFSRQMPDKEYTNVQFITLVKNLQSLVQQEAKRGQVEINGIHEIMQYDQLYVLGDQGKLQQALINIMLNAIYASAQAEQNKKVIDVTMHHDEQSLFLSIRDHGIGIDESIKDKLFDPFFTTKEIGQGTGLGLSISLGIIEHHKGQLIIDNMADGGVKAQIILPLVDSDNFTRNLLNTN